MILLDYLYFQLTNLYNFFNKEGGGKAYGLLMLCALPWWNLICILIIIDYCFEIKLGPINKYYLLLYSLPIILLVSLRYWKYTSYESIKEKIDKMSKLGTTLLDIFVILYVMVSFLSIIGIGLYIGAQKS